VHPGDVLILDGDTCQVRKFGLRATTYTGFDDRRRGQVLIGAEGLPAGLRLLLDRLRPALLDGGSDDQSRHLQ
jgi:hypothetical protein